MPISFVVDKNDEHVADVTVYVLDVQVNAKITFISLDDLVNQIDMVLAHPNIKSKRAFSPKVDMDVIGKKAVVATIEPVADKKFFHATCNIMDNEGFTSLDTYKLVIWNKNELRKGDIVLFVKNEKGFISYELSSEFSQDELGF
jgi:hypothetical protein